MIDLSTVSGEFWQLPAIVILAIIVIGWLLRSNREDHKSQTQAQAETAAWLRDLLKASQAERTETAAQMATMIRDSTAVNQQTANAIAALAEAVAREMALHEERACNRFKEQERNARERNQALSSIMAEALAETLARVLVETLPRVLAQAQGQGQGQAIGAGGE